MAAASILAELGVLAGVRKLACLPQEAWSTLAGRFFLRQAQAGASVGTGVWQTPAQQPSCHDSWETQQ